MEDVYFYYLSSHLVVEHIFFTKIEIEVTSIFVNLRQLIIVTIMNNSSHVSRNSNINIQIILVTHQIVPCCSYLDIVTFYLSFGHISGFL
jgi:hypothetical protein